MCSYVALARIAFVSAFLKLRFSFKFVQTKLLSCIVVKTSLWSDLVKLATLQLNTYFVRLSVVTNTCYLKRLKDVIRAKAVISRNLR